jgi:uncharacterized protein
MPAQSSTKDFKDAAARDQFKLEVARFFSSVSANEVDGVLKFVMNYPKEAAIMKSSDGLTALMFAAREGYKETAWLLIHAAPKELEVGNDNNSTALMFAAHAGKATIVALLLEAGADVNHVNKNGHTPLMSASANGFRNTVEQLLKFNADITPRDAEGNTALDYARENGFTDIEKMIATAAVTQAAVREKAAADARARAEEENRPVISDDNGASLKDLERRMMKANLAYPVKPQDDPDRAKDDASAEEARRVLKDLSKKMDR